MFFSVVTSLSVVTCILLLDYYSTTTLHKKTASEGRLCVLFTHVILINSRFFFSFYIPPFISNILSGYIEILFARQTRQNTLLNVVQFPIRF